MKIGAYAIEQDYSHYVAYAAKTVLAVVGTATKGPVGKAEVCVNAQELANKFGKLNPKCYGLYAGQYFLSQASKLYYVRAASKDAKPGMVSIPGENASKAEVKEAFKLEGKNPGSYLNGLSLVVSETKVGSNIYNFNLEDKDSNVIERNENLTFDDLKEGAELHSLVIKKADQTTATIKKGKYPLSPGDDGIDKIQAGDYLQAAQVLLADQCDMTLLSCPGESDAAVVQGLLSLAEEKGDCLYLVDPPEGLTRDGVIDWSNGAGAYKEHAAFDSSYGALYYDWCTIYDPVNKCRVSVPPSVVVAPVYAYSDRMTEVWFAPAGLQRGLVHGTLNVNSQLNKADTELMYSDPNAVNAIYDDPQVGLVLWGQKTLLRTQTSLNRVNVRRLLNYLKRMISAACNYLTFEPNDRITWNSFKMKIEPVLETVRKKRGLYEYHIVKGESIVTPEDIDNYRMPCMILIRPTKAAEDIPIYFTITSTGADFNDILEMNGVVEK